MTKIKEWIEEKLVIDIPEKLDHESYIEGFVAGIQNERKRVREELRKVT